MMSLSIVKSFKKLSVSVSERHASIQTTLEGLEGLVDLNGGTETRVSVCSVCLLTQPADHLDGKLTNMIDFDSWEEVLSFVSRREIQGLLQSQA